MSLQKQYLAVLTLVICVALTIVVASHAATNPASPSPTSVAAKALVGQKHNPYAKIKSVTCAPYEYEHIYLCDFSGKSTEKGTKGKRFCTETYVHDAGGSITTFGVWWKCGAVKKYGPTLSRAAGTIPFPGDPYSGRALPSYKTNGGPPS